MINITQRVSSIGCLVALFLSLFIQSTGTSVSNRSTIGSETKEIKELVASGTSDGVLIQWQHEVTEDNLGFNVFRLVDGRRVKVNREMILGAVFAPKRPGNVQSNYSFSFLDKNGTADSRYIIEAIDLQGVLSESKTIGVIAPGNLRRDGLQAVAGVELQRPIEDSYPTAANKSISFNGPQEDQWFVASQPGVKISIKQDGWYKATYDQIAATGFNTAIDIKNLQLFADGREVPILTSKATGTFSSGDSFEFFGRGLDLATTDTRVYYLIAGSSPGKRVKGDLRASAGPIDPARIQITPRRQFEPPRSLFFGFVFEFLRGLGRSNEPSTASTKPHTELSISSAPSQKIDPSKAEPSVNSKKKTRPKKAKKSRREYSHAAAAAPTSFSFTVEKKERINYFVTVQNGDTENYFGVVVAGTPVTQNLTISNLDTNAAGPAYIEVALQGVGSVPHQINVSVNNTSVTTLNFIGVEHVRRVVELPISLLVNGANAVKFTSQIGGVTLVDYVRLTYPHLFRADNNSLRLSLRPSQSVTVDGFTSSNIRLIDVTDPYAVTLTKPIVQASGGGFAADISGVPGKSKARVVHAQLDTQSSTPAGFSLNVPSSLNLNTNAADLVIIAHKTLVASAAPLVTLRQSQGLVVSVVDIEDVYDEFDFGVHGPQAIKNFLSRTQDVWSTKPRYAILLGDSSLDPRNYEAVGDFDLVPTKLLDATFNETASDDWLSDFNGDGLPEIAMGRLPARTVAEANLIVTKIVNFLPANVPQSALLVADYPTGYYFDFEHANDEVQALLPAGITVQKVYRRTAGGDSIARANVNAHFNAGQVLVNYSGHGNVDTWTSAPIFNTADASATSNGNKLPFVVVMDCLNGYFQDPRLLGLAEALVKAPNGGAVAVFASSGLTVPDGQHAMSNQLYTLVFGSTPIALGDAIKTSKAATTDIDVRHTWIFFGDPSMRLR